ncbi:MAG TPA: hypothetical protein VGE00_05875, partial [Gammaproteobacteria bacterium]
MKARRFRLIITLLLLLSVTIAALLHSRTVLQWLWQQVETLTQGQVSARHIDGVLAGPISVDGLVIKTPASEIAINAARLDWHPGRLLAGRLSLIETEADEVVVTLLTRERPPEPAGSFDGITAPLAVQAGRLAVRRLVFRKEGMNDIAIAAIRVEEAHWQGERLTVGQISLDLPWGALTARGDFATHLGSPIDLESHFTLNRALFDAPLEATGQLEGTLGQPRFTQQISGAARGRVSGTITLAPGPLHWQAEADITPFSLAQLQPQWRPLSVGGHLEGSGDFLNNELRGTVSLSDPRLRRWRGDFALTQQRERIAVHELQLRGDGHAAQLAA